MTARTPSGPGAPENPSRPRARGFGRGFQPAAGLLQERIRKAGEKRGFAVARLLTHWDEIVGADTARTCRPVRIGYARGGMGATLTLLVPGAQAPCVQMQLEAIRAQVNAVYGYNAVARIHLTQTAPQGFAEAQATFDPAPASPSSADPRAPGPGPRLAQGTTIDPGVDRAARACADGVGDEGLRAALENLARNVLNRNSRTARTP